MREMQIITTLPELVSKINKTTDSKRWRGCGEREPSFTVGGL